MKVSKLVGERVKQIPASATTKSHIYMLRAGFMKQVSTGIYTLLPPAMRSILKIQNIVREEMNKIGGQEVLCPVVMPRELWEESGRYSAIGDEMARFNDRSGHDMVLGMTHEEAIVHMCRNTVKSYDQLPYMVYQIQTKFRDEPRSRAGLIRVREFTMKDAYSFHMNEECLKKHYQEQYDAYVRIFKRIGMKNVVVVESDTGMMGGKVAHEFMLLTDAGEDTLVLCDKCGYSANIEVAEGILPKFKSKTEELKLVDVGKETSIEKMCKLLKVESHQTCKAVCYAIKGDTKTVVVAFVRGDLDVNEAKLQRVIKKEIAVNDALDGEVFAAGYIGPLGLPDKNIIKVYDISLKGEECLACGANRAPYHYTGLSISRDLPGIKFEDFSKVNEGMVCKHCGKGTLKFARGVEVGNIFQLGTKYTQSMNMTVHDSEGREVNPIMGCYGIGIGRALGSVLEEQSDDKGLVFPVSIAPWQVYLCPLKYIDENIKKITDGLYEQMTAAGIEVILDDRETSAGVKFADSELMGIPLRVVVSERSLADNKVELTSRASGEKLMISVNEIIKTLQDMIKQSN